MRQQRDPLKDLSIKGTCHQTTLQGKKRTYLALDDDAGVIAIKLAYAEQIVQIWDIDGTLIEGDEYAT
jgi:hypothetical protein